MTEIRLAQVDDLEKVVELFDAYRVWYRKSSDIKAAKTFLEQRLTLADSVIYLVTEQNEPLGFTQLYPSFSSTKMKRMWILNDLYVQPQHRGKGYSKQLISAAKDHCRKTEGCGILLETETTNDIGNKLYPSAGFELEQNNFYFWSLH